MMRSATPVTSQTVTRLASDVDFTISTISVEYAGCAWRKASGAMIRRSSSQPDMPQARPASICCTGTASSAPRKISAVYAAVHNASAMTAQANGLRSTGHSMPCRTAGNCARP